MHITVFPQAEASLDRSIEVEQTWEEFVASNTKFDKTKDEKTKCQLLMPGRFLNRKAGKTKGNVKDVSLATLDIDDVDEETLDAFQDWLIEKGYKALVYTTWNHGDAIRGIDKKGNKVDPICKLRVLLPLSRPVRAIEWEYFWKAYDAEFFHLADHSCKDASRGYFLPGIPKKHVGTEVEKLYYVKEFKGDKTINVDVLLSSSLEDIQKTAEEYAEGEANKERIPVSVIKSFVTSLAKGKQKVLGAKMIEALKGEIFESEGNRNNTLYQFAQELAKAFPHGKVSNISAPFEGAIESMREEDDGAPTCEQFDEMILRAQVAVLKEKQAKKIKADLEERQEQIDDEDDSKAMSKEQLLSYLKKCGREQDADNFKSLIWVGRSDLYVFDGAGYSGPSDLKAIYIESKQIAEPVLKKLGFRKDLFISNDEGPPKRVRKGQDALIDEYGAYATCGVTYNMQGLRYYDADARRLHLSAMTPAKYQARRIPRVEAWLRAVSSDEENYESFCRYLSRVPDTNQPLAALVFVGPEGIGKSALAAGLARLWQNVITGSPAHPVTASSVFENFNDNLLNSPIVLADEEMPRDFKGNVMTTALRRFISDTQHEISAKFRSKITLQGAGRLIIALNDMESFAFKENFSDQDVEAVYKRFLVVRTNQLMHTKAKKLFDYETFVNQGQIAQHVLYLAEQVRQSADWKDIKKERFGVVTNSRKVIESSSFTARMVLSWIAKQLIDKRLTDPESLKVAPQMLPAVVVLPDRNVMVSPVKIFDDWDTMFASKPGYRPRSHYDVIKALGAVSKADRLEVQLGRGRKKYTMYSVDIEHLLDAMASLEATRDMAETVLDIYYDVDVMYPKSSRATPASEAKRKAAIRRLQEGDFETFEDEVQRISVMQDTPVCIAEQDDPELALAWQNILDSCDESLDVVG